jgi:hypothetical protein
MDIHTPSYDQWFRRYALSKLMNAAEFCAEQIGGKLTISNFCTSFEMKTPETLNTKRVDIFLRFPTNICVFHADKPNSGYGHWKTEWGKISTEIWKQIEFLKTEEDWVRSDCKLNGRSMPFDHFRSDCMRKLEWGMLELRSFLDGNDQQQGKAGSDRYEWSRRSSLMKNALWK